VGLGRFAIRAEKGELSLELKRMRADCSRRRDVRYDSSDVAVARFHAAAGQSVSILYTTHFGAGLIAVMRNFGRAGAKLAVQRICLI
jgi:hypothetical protein